MIETVDSSKAIIVFTDYSVMTSIIKQIKLFTSFTDKLNLRLIQTSQYLLQFFLDVRYKSEYTYVISDVLFQLAQLNFESKNTSHNDSNMLKELEAYNVRVYQTSLVKMSASFCKQLIKDYKADSFLVKIFKCLTSNQLNLENFNEAVKKQSEIMFVICKSLLYYKRAKADYLIISATIRDKIFRLTHNKNSYIKLH